MGNYENNYKNKELYQVWPTKKATFSAEAYGFENGSSKPFRPRRRSILQNAFGIASGACLPGSRPLARKVTDFAEDALN
jgi:hypothetical protein